MAIIESEPWTCSIFLYWEFTFIQHGIEWNCHPCLLFMDASCSNNEFCDASDGSSMAKQWSWADDCLWFVIFILLNSLHFQHQHQHQLLNYILAVFVSTLLKLEPCSPYPRLQHIHDQPYNIYDMPIGVIHSPQWHRESRQRQAGRYCTIDTIRNTIPLCGRRPPPCGQFEL